MRGALLFLVATACFHTGSAVRVENLLNNFLQNLTDKQVPILKNPAIEGSPCIRHGIIGTCLKIYRCPSVILDLVQREHPSLCGSEGKVPLVCSTDCEESLVLDIRLAVFSERVGLMWKSNSKARNAYIDYVEELPVSQETAIFGLSGIWDVNIKCQRVRSECRIVGGCNALPGEFPFMALLGYNYNQSGIKWLCGGTLISNIFVLTAGHCTSDDNHVDVSHVALGLTNRSEVEGNLMGYTYIYSVEEIIKHSGYNSPNIYNDIALLKLNKPVDLTPKIGIACLDCLNLFEPHDSNEVWDHANATGWGYLGKDGKLAEILQVVELDFINYPICERLYRQASYLKDGIDNKTQICYGDDNREKDTCMGDSGGPLMVFIRGNSHLAHVIGITSTGNKCPIKASIYTKVQPYLAWIDDIVKPNKTAILRGVIGLLPYYAVNKTLPCKAGNSTLPCKTPNSTTQLSTFT